jgi:hypothetical protein
MVEIPRWYLTVSIVAATLWYVWQVAGLLARVMS